jgi:hypothetical protein
MDEPDAPESPPVRTITAQTVVSLDQDLIVTTTDSPTADVAESIHRVGVVPKLTLMAGASSGPVRA